MQACPSQGGKHLHRVLCVQVVGQGLRIPSGVQEVPCCTTCMQAHYTIEIQRLHVQAPQHQSVVMSMELLVEAAKKYWKGTDETGRGQILEEY